MPLEFRIPAWNSSAIVSMMPLPQRPTGFWPGSPMMPNVGSIVSGSMTQDSIAPSVARMPQEMSPPSKAGPAEQAHETMKSRLPKTISPFVPRSMNRDSSSRSQSMLANVPAVISPPT